VLWAEDGRQGGVRRANAVDDVLKLAVDGRRVADDTHAPARQAI
jgi:hypothetical protein